MAHEVIIRGTVDGDVTLTFADAQEAMERMGAANLETLRSWVLSLEKKAQLQCGGR
jgi:hypothetical protein